MRNPEYFWKDGQVVSHYFEGLDLKAPALFEHGLVGCPVVDMNCEAGTWGRIGWYTYIDQSRREVNWKDGKHHDLPAEFKTALLLLGVTP